MDPLIGSRVQVIIHDDGAPNPPSLPSGTIIEKLPGGGPMYVVHLDEPVRYFRPPLNFKPPIPRDWTLSDLIIQARYTGHELDDLLTESDDVVVMITNHSTGDYFAIGSVRKAA